MLLVAMICFMACPKSYCTDQKKDVVFIDGQECLFLESPMRDHGYKLPNFDFESTANWGGYTPEWEIKEGKLWLTAFHAKMNGNKVEPKELFHKDLPIHATWVNGPMYATKDIVRDDEGLVFGTETERFFFIDGNVHKRACHNNKIPFELGMLGIGFSDKAGKLKIDSVENIRAAVRLDNVFVGVEVISMMDIDGEVFDVSNFSKSKAYQFFRVVPNQLIRFSVRSVASGKVTEIEFTCISHRENVEAFVEGQRALNSMRFDLR